MVGNLNAVQFLQKTNIEGQDLVISFEIIQFMKLQQVKHVLPLYIN